LKFRLVVQASNMTHPLGQATVASSRLGPVTSLGLLETAAAPFPTGAALCEADTGQSNFAARLSGQTQKMWICCRITRSPSRSVDDVVS